MAAENPIMNFMNRIVDLIVLNLCFIVSCIPVITIGAGITALYSVNLKMVCNEESYVFRDYWRAFGENFRQATQSFMLFLAAGAVFVCDLRLIPLLPAGLQYIFYAVLIVCGVVYVVELMYVFPYIARFRDGLWRSFKNALLIGGARAGYTVTLFLMMLAFFAAGLACITGTVELLFFWGMAGFSSAGYVQAWVLRKVFDRYA